MAYVSVAEFQQYMQGQQAKEDAIAGRLDQLQQSLIEVRGQIAVVETQSDEKFKKVIDNFEVRIANMTTSGNQLISDVQVLKNDIILTQTHWKELLENAESNFSTFNAKFETNLQELNKKTDETFQAVKNKFDEVESNYIKSTADNNTNYATLYNKTEITFKDVQAQLANLQKAAGQAGDAVGGAGGASQQEQVRRRGFLPIKNIVPKKMNDKVEEWRGWKEDAADFFDTQVEGMGKFLLEIVGKHEGSVEELILDIELYTGDNGQKFTNEDAVMTWRALKRLTEGVAQKVVMNTRHEHGFVAWNNLAKFFEPRLALQQGAALQELTRMILTRAKTPEETRKMMVVFQSKVKDAEDHNRPLDSDYLKSVLGGFIDETTRIGTVEYQGKKYDSETFEKEILKFINGVAAPSMSTSSGDTNMGLAPVVGPQDPWAGQYGDEWPQWPVDSSGPYGQDSEAPQDAASLSALQKGKGKKGKGGGKGACFGCGSLDHQIAACPVAAKGKGKGEKGFKGKGYGPPGGYAQHGGYGLATGKNNYAGQNWPAKGSSKGNGGGYGPRGGCWKCGGPHFADQCTGGGGQIKSLASLQEAPRDVPSGTVAATIKGKDKMKSRIEAWENFKQNGNMFEALTEDETVLEKYEESKEEIKEENQGQVKDEDEMKAEDREWEAMKMGSEKYREAQQQKEMERLKEASDSSRRLQAKADGRRLKSKMTPQEADDIVQEAMERSPSFRRHAEAVGETMRRKTKLTRNQRRKEKGKSLGGSKKTRTLLEMMSKEVEKQERREDNKLNLFVAVEPEGVNSIQDEVKWELLTLYVDSGATETVIAETMLSMMEIKDSPQSKRGVEYEVANGKKIPNLGQKQFVAHSEDGTKRHVLAQVCEVNKALLSVSKMVSHGNKVVFGELDNNGGRISYVEDNTTKERLWIEEENGMFALKVWVRTDGKEAEAPF